jgi:hypothetical protein
MKKYSKPYPTIEEVIKNKDYDYVSYRINHISDEDGIFAGCFKTENGKIISLDGDSYSLNEKVIASEEWEDEEENINNGLTVIVEGNWI